MFKVIIRLGNAGRAKGVGFGNVGSGLKIRLMDALNDIRPGHRQKVIIALQGVLMFLKMTFTKIFFFQRMTLNHRSHCSVENQNTARKSLLQFCHIIMLCPKTDATNQIDPQN